MVLSWSLSEKSLSRCSMAASSGLVMAPKPRILSITTCTRSNRQQQLSAFRGRTISQVIGNHRLQTMHANSQKPPTTRICECASIEHNNQAQRMVSPDDAGVQLNKLGTPAGSATGGRSSSCGKVPAGAHHESRHNEGSPAPVQHLPGVVIKVIIHKRH